MDVINNFMFNENYHNFSNYFEFYYENILNTFYRIPNCDVTFVSALLQFILRFNPDSYLFFTINNVLTRKLIKYSIIIFFLYKLYLRII